MHPDSIVAHGPHRRQHVAASYAGAPSTSGGWALASSRAPPATTQTSLAVPRSGRRWLRPGRASAGADRPRKARHRLAPGDDVRRRGFLTLYWDGAKRAWGTLPSPRTRKSSSDRRRLQGGDPRGRPVCHGADGRADRHALPANTSPDENSSEESSTDPILLFIPLAVLALVAVLGFVGCTKDFDSLVVSPPAAPDAIRGRSPSLWPDRVLAPLGSARQSCEGRDRLAAWATIRASTRAT